LKKRERQQKMVKLTKSLLPDDIKIESDNDYRHGTVFHILAEDCHHKCYICEDKPTSINVEHIVSHRNDPALKYNWHNLFIACTHCNNIKGTRYDDVINPTECDPEDYIALSIEIQNDFIDTVHVDFLQQDPCTLKTAELLRFVYNGGSTDIKEIECVNLRNEHLLPDIKLFKQYIQGFFAEPELGYDAIIKKEIDRSSKFAAFKRKIIRDNPELLSFFSDALV